jgi:hypothetical protein
MKVEPYYNRNFISQKVFIIFFHVVTRILQVSNHHDHPKKNLMKKQLTTKMQSLKKVNKGV